MQSLIFVFSCLVVAFGTPSSMPILGWVAASIGYALFLGSVLDESPKKKFVLGTLWYAFVTMIQYSWYLTHPYYYVYALYAVGPFIIGAEFGLLTMLVSRERLQSLFGLLGVAGAWVLLEWFRLFWFMGLPFNVSGLALASTDYSLQMASLGGIYFLSFWVMLTNLLFLRKSYALFLFAALFPYFYGYFQIQEKEVPTLKALLVQPAFEIEEEKGFLNLNLGQKVALVLSEWEEVAKLIQGGLKEKPDLIVLPENTVPFASGSCLFPESEAHKLLETIFSKKPDKNAEFTRAYENYNFVCNAYFADQIAKITDTPLLIGMEHKEGDKFYSSAILYSASLAPYRYDKQVLVPMAEYIPSEWLRNAAKSYGITGSFTHGDGAKLFTLNGIRCGATICYEEMLGSIARPNKTLGANLLINLTNDGWYPHSTLPQQHLDLARLRAVELGLPLLRACNTGITCAVDSYGRVVKTLGENSQEKQTLRGSLSVALPINNYWTLYSETGDGLIVLLSALSAIGLLFSPKKR